MSKIINFLLLILKWPCAIGGLFLLLPVIKTDMQIVYQGLTTQMIYWFCLPLLVACLLWMVIPNMDRSFIAILKHELTHMLFALITGHTPKDISIKRGIGGSFSYEGAGNWLIAIAPYFFPLLILVMIGMGGLYALMGQNPSNIYWAIFGVVFGFHIMSTFSDIHTGQTDFKAAGYVFSCFFLPMANLLMYGLSLAYVAYGFCGFGIYVTTLFHQIELFISLF